MTKADEKGIRPQKRGWKANITHKIGGLHLSHKVLKWTCWPKRLKQRRRARSTLRPCCDRCHRRALMRWRWTSQSICKMIKKLDACRGIFQEVVLVVLPSATSIFESAKARWDRRQADRWEGSGDPLGLLRRWNARTWAAHGPTGSTVNRSSMVLFGTGQPEVSVTGLVSICLLPLDGWGGSAWIKDIAWHTIFWLT